MYEQETINRYSKYHTDTIKEDQNIYEILQELRCMYEIFIYKYKCVSKNKPLSQSINAGKYNLGLKNGERRGQCNHIGS